ncbi:MAG: Hpt domain-containing protein [Elusimicrobiota bacterium]|nr:Hpt domain-containing protein [Elusimicrobiota bacterium]
MHKNILKIDEDLADIIPGYMENRTKELKMISVLIGKKDFDSLRIIGHKLKGSGSGYGIDFFTDLGAKMEEAALKKDADLIEVLRKEYTDFMASVEIIYETID